MLATAAANSLSKSEPMLLSVSTVRQGKQRKQGKNAVAEGLWRQARRAGIKPHG